MSYPIPGIIESETVEGESLPVMFIAVAVDANAIMYRGYRIEANYLAESPKFVDPNNRVRCIYVPETEQVYILEKIE